ncbi:MAG: hypothetical protein ABSE48_21195 [Verrucomicrobiota bacterium]
MRIHEAQLLQSVAIILSAHEAVKKAKKRKSSSPAFPVQEPLQLEIAMNEQDIKRLQNDVDALKKIVASQAPHLLLLLALVKTESRSHRSNIEKEIDDLPLGDSPEASEQKEQARELVRRYFPNLYTPA